MSKIGLSVLLTAFIISGCVANSDEAASQKNITQTEANHKQSNTAIRGNVAIVTQDSVSDTTPRKNQTELKLEAIILDEIRGNWVDDNGNVYKLTKSSEQKMFELLLPEADKQFELSFNAHSAKLAEEITKSNIETTITEIDNKRIVTERKAFSRGEEKLVVALENINTVSENVGRRVNNLALVSETGNNTQANNVTKNSEETVRKILLNIHKYAIATVEEFSQPRSLENVSANSNKTN